MPCDVGIELEYSSTGKFYLSILLSQTDLEYREHVEIVIENYDRPVFRGFENVEAARTWLGAQLNFLETGEFDVGPGQTPPILVDLNLPEHPNVPPATPGQNAPQPPATAHNAPQTPATPTHNARQPPAQAAASCAPPRGGGGLFASQARGQASHSSYAPLAAMSGLGAALPREAAFGGPSTPSFRKPSDNPATPSPSKGKGRSYVNTRRRDLEGEASEVTHASFNRAILNELARQIRSVQRDALIDIVNLYLNTNYNDEASQEIRDTLDEDLSIEIMLDRLVRAGMPIREAFLILTLFQLARAFTGAN
jgi:hypothetical protein